ncbi:UNKNOWN [Stylonychia lemnae]|uniref:Uncharacterized protein n=1 Tax=Stylonychia lemnae TaxID=5949 RepID=A0A078B931_STYLE|nr:UNKNOWN [Stylonychia lemnae]|eukprot:CDW91025.1 UNKNOWN [Stylonychia lemnae]
MNDKLKAGQQIQPQENNNNLLEKLDDMNLEDMDSELQRTKKNELLDRLRQRKKFRKINKEQFDEKFKHVDKYTQQLIDMMAQKKTPNFEALNQNQMKMRPQRDTLFRNFKIPQYPDPLRNYNARPQKYGKMRKRMYDEEYENEEDNISQ